MNDTTSDLLSRFPELSEDGIRSRSPEDRVSEATERLVERAASDEFDGQAVFDIVFDVPPPAWNVYCALHRVGPTTTVELERVLNRHRSSINRSLNTLLEAGMVMRRRQVLAGGGQIYEYEVIPPEDLGRAASAALGVWYTEIRDVLVELGTLDYESDP